MGMGGRRRVKWTGSGESAGTRTQGPRLKRAMLYQLSYRLTLSTLKKAFSFVLASLGPSPYRTGTPRSLARCSRAAKPF